MREAKIVLNLWYNSDENRWRGKVKGIDDNSGNEIDCYLYSFEEAVDSLKEQIIESKHYTKLIPLSQAIKNHYQRTAKRNNTKIIIPSALAEAFDIQEEDLKYITVDY